MTGVDEIRRFDAEQWIQAHRADLPECVVETFETSSKRITYLEGEVCGLEDALTEADKEVVDLRKQAKSTAASS